MDLNRVSAGMPKSLSEVYVDAYMWQTHSEATEKFIKWYIFDYVAERDSALDWVFIAIHNHAYVQAANEQNVDGYSQIEVSYKDAINFLEKARAEGMKMETPTNTGATCLQNLNSLVSTKQRVRTRW